MRGLKSVLFALTLSGATSSAFAANANLTVNVNLVPAQVSVTRCTVSVDNTTNTSTRICNPVNYAAYAVTVTNATTNVINQVVLTGDTAVSGATPSQTADFVESIPSGLCTATTATHIQCNLGQLNGSTSFLVAFKSPPNIDASTLASVTYDANAQIGFGWDLTYSMAASPGTPSSQVEQTGTAGTALVTTTSTTINSQLTTYIPTTGGTFFTGTGTALSSDTQTTKIKVPGEGLKTAGIDERSTVGGITNDTLYTFTTTLTIPNTNKQGVSQLFASPVAIFLRRDSSTIRSFNKFDRVPIYYTSDPSEPVYYDGSNPLPSCYDTAYYPDPVNSPGPSTQYPLCVDQRIGISKKTTSPLPDGTSITADDIGDWLFVIKALQNGKISW